jgi:hypothetical protein
MATRTGTRSAGRKGASTGGRITAGRGRAGRPARGRGKAAPKGPMGLLNRVTSMVGRGGGRGARGGGSMVNKASNFVNGFLSGGDKGRRGRRRR